MRERDIETKRQRERYTLLSNEKPLAGSKESIYIFSKEFPFYFLLSFSFKMEQIFV